ncbi:MAG TPA: 30S ribosomal protein S14 [Nitrosomonas sp.]|mgnify:FL=1|nr:30S ribosomal protein S14 [Nitrosomonas sp.]HMW20441.1 30S ribosomal protein S14 [Nitrosomonas sp.]HMW68125.1 30S ribosomal protein S14 [Nitrosomonas sp.]HMY60923.1 30S ribosomal protein S14 [Nitrosomonas sp.]HMY89865.1 30S ribosomal protein S14 [Nitrosomonas sp.]
MAKIAIINRNLKRQKVVAKYAKIKLTLLEILTDKSKSVEEIDAVKVKLQKLPRNACQIRLRNRCALTGRGRGFYRKFGLGRIKFREMAMNGEIPGITKASW